MSDKSWKRRERQIAEFFHGKRIIPADTRTSGDVLHPKLYIEVKERKKHTAVSLWDDTKGKADKEKKTPVVCLCEKGRPGFWILVKSDDFLKL